MSQAFKEIVIFLAIFIILSLGMHMDKWISAPVSHWQELPNHLMPWHPLIYVAVVYFILGTIRVTYLLLKKLFVKN